MVRRPEIVQGESDNNCWTVPVYHHPAVRSLLGILGRPVHERLVVTERLANRVSARRLHRTNLRNRHRAYWSWGLDLSETQERGEEGYRRTGSLLKSGLSFPQQVL